jgi:8-oxo-dGTP pyrophosphatase MutT (NUDIX family)
MATTAMFIEILIIGLQAVVWVALLAASIFGIKSVQLQNLSDWETLIIVLVFAIAYVLGILMDRLADTAFNKIYKIRKLIKPLIRKSTKGDKDETLPAPFGEMRLQIMMQNDTVGKFMDYQRSRLRIARATVLNLPLIIISGIIFLITRTNFSSLQIAMFALVGVVLIALSLYVAFRIDTAQTRTIVDAYRIITNKRFERVAAICYRRVDKGIEFLLVRTSDGLRWTFPKGHIEKGESPEKAAEREAKEEAGVTGKVSPVPIVEYSFPLQSSGQGTKSERVAAFLLEVTEKIDLQEPAREPTWFEPHEAKKKLAEHREQEFAVEHELVVDAAIKELGTR